MTDRVYVASRKGLFTLDRSRRGWSVARSAFAGDNCTLVHEDVRDGARALYCAMSHGHFGAKLHRSRDGGETWSEIAAPAYPPRPEGAEPEVDHFGKKIPDTLQLIWALASGGADQPGRLWCGTIPGALFRSDDDGTSWTMVSSLWNHPDRKMWFGGGADWPGIHSICVDPRDSARVLVGVSCGGVWLTEDDGATWRCHGDGMRAAYMPPEQARDPRIQDPHCVAQCPTDPQKVWVQHHNGIFRSTDGAATWSEIEGVHPSTFGFPVAVHPDDGDTAWFVPGQSDEKRIPVSGRVVVTRTRDGGRSFETLANGLPQEHAYDLVFRHSLDIDETGNRLAFGSTTGAVWITEDQGDAWTEVTAHLPPVYAVRFAKS